MLPAGRVARHNPTYVRIARLHDCDPYRQRRLNSAVKTMNCTPTTIAAATAIAVVSEVNPWSRPTKGLKRRDAGN